MCQVLARDKISGVGSTEMAFMAIEVDEITEKSSWQEQRSFERALRNGTNRGGQHAAPPTVSHCFLVGKRPKRKEL